METEVEKAPGFTQERLNDANNGKLRISDLNPTEREQLNEYSRTGRIETEQAEVIASVDSPREDVKPEDTAEKALKKKLFDTQVEKNRKDQLLKQANDKVEFVNKQLEELKSNQNITQRTDDNFDDATQNNNVERITRLEEMLKASLEREQNTATTQRSEADVMINDLEAQRSELAIEKLQKSFPDLKTTVPMSQLDGELTRFMGEVGGIDNVNKYLEDPEFRKQKEAEGVTPLSDAFIENKDRFGKVVDINHAFSINKDENGLTHRQRNSDATIESFHMKNQLESGAYTEQLRNAKLSGATSVIDKVASNKHTAPTMSPSSGADLPTEGMTSGRALEILKRIKPLINSGQQLSAEQRGDWNKYQEFMEAGYGRN